MELEMSPFFFRLTLRTLLALGACASSLLASPAVVQQQPVLAPGYARAWILRQHEPSESLRTPVMYSNGAPIGASQPATIFYRDLPVGTYQVTVDSCTKDVG